MKQVVYDDRLRNPGYSDEPPGILFYLSFSGTMLDRRGIDTLDCQDCGEATRCGIANLGFMVGNPARRVFCWRCVVVTNTDSKYIRGDIHKAGECVCDRRCAPTANVDVIDGRRFVDPYARAR